MIYNQQPPVKLSAYKIENAHCKSRPKMACTYHRATRTEAILLFSVTRPLGSAGVWEETVENGKKLGLGEDRIVIHRVRIIP